MKSKSCFIFFGILVFLMSSNTSAQNLGEILQRKTIAIKGKINYLPIYKKNIFISTNPPEEVEHVSVNKELDVNWDNKNFNPYTKELSFPVPISFTDTNFASPVQGKMVVTSRYGLRRGRPHRGIDIDLQVGDSVKTILGGKIRYAGYTRGYGKTVIVRHYNGLETVYAHLSKLLVETNQEVEKGEIIGKGGVSGNARGSHLHLEVKYHGKSIHPEYLFDFSDSTKVRSELVYVTPKWTTPRLHRSHRKSKIVLHQTEDDIDPLEMKKKEVYTVRKGDTLSRIANKYGLAVSQICKLNAIKKNSVLKIGQQIIIN
ncbi:peptidoglycan DD-metalloendopeptidase family protein [Aquimarina algicola]|uniref:LysM peptidoglycan-binding domain-containing protein n=1 Tax=Aquimarina algicola TaxID=2589995 RepID=A0A504JQ62_9FLAO|nr:peptidoglycan DD-metalloendopeptidase family protein [Aquimarina algicola]TPN88969.1 LysM peptidoglycan-binding domain-containing protein [Aquimarina algicola]